MLIPFVKNLLSLKVDDIRILDIASQTPVQNILSSFVEAGQVKITRIEDPTNGPTVAAMRAFRQGIFRELNPEDVMLHMDVDEFLVLRKGRTLHSLFKNRNDKLFWIDRFNILPTEELKIRTIEAIVANLKRFMVCFRASSMPEYESHLNLRNIVPKMCHRAVPLVMETAYHRAYISEDEPVAILPDICVVHIPYSNIQRFRRLCQNVNDRVQEDAELPAEDRYFIPSHPWHIMSRAVVNSRVDELYESLFLSKEDLKKAHKEGCFASVNQLMFREQIYIEPLKVNHAEEYVIRYTRDDSTN
ncbi:MAG: hypothetical protein VX278_21570 [Myxococcota bacterium]|nr:hypothetical protein [Myxococcota bacterium]